MANEELENIDSQIDEEGTEEVEETQEEDTQPEYTDSERKLYARAKAAEAELKDFKSGKVPAKSNKSGDFDYGEIAFMKQEGIKSEVEMEFTKKQMKESGKKLHEIVNAAWFKAELADMKEVEKSLEATPTGRRSGGVAANSTEYWLSKPIEEVPKDMLREVVKAKREKAGGGSKFYNS
jgi:hypothetical protein